MKRLYSSYEAKGCVAIFVRVFHHLVLPGYYATAGNDFYQAMENRWPAANYYGWLDDFERRHYEHFAKQTPRT